jgi:hypothetical protein
VGYAAKPLIFAHQMLPDRAFDTLIKCGMRIPS